MQGVAAARRQHLVDGDELLHGGDFRREDDAVLAEAHLFGAGGGEKRRLQHRLAGHRAGVFRVCGLGVLVHQGGEQVLVERAPVGADADRLAVLDRLFDDRAELQVLLVFEADVAGVDPVLRKSLGAGRMIGEQLVADVMKVADQRHEAADLGQPVADMRYGRRRFVAIDGDADHLGAGAGQCGDLRDGAGDIGRIGVGHRLDDDRRAAAHLDGAVAPPDDDRRAAMAGGRRSGDFRVGVPDDVGDGARDGGQDVHADLSGDGRELMIIWGLA
jgi:hypothetical protein